MPDEQGLHSAKLKPVDSEAWIQLWSIADPISFAEQKEGLTDKVRDQATQITDLEKHIEEVRGSVMRDLM